MSRVRRFLHFWFFGCVEEPAKEITPTEAYQAGFANGAACGELRGRNAAITELELILAAKGKGEFEVEDVAKLRHRTFH